MVLGTAASLLSGCLAECSDIACVMQGVSLTTEDGKPLPLVQIAADRVPLPTSYVASSSSPGFDLLITPVGAPNWGDPISMIAEGATVQPGVGTLDESLTPTITEQPPNLVLAIAGSEVEIEIPFHDPNGQTNAFYVVPGTKERPYRHCVWMSPAERDGKVDSVVRLKMKLGTVDFAKEGFWTNRCGQLLPLKPPIAGVGSDGGVPDGGNVLVDGGSGGAIGAGGPKLLAGNTVALHVATPTGGGGGNADGGGGGSGGTCPGGQLGSLRYCVQNGAGGPCDCVHSETLNSCVTSDFWRQNFTVPFPAMCAPVGGSCLGSDGRTITAYCCPGLSCNGGGGPACGGGSGTCQKI